MTVTVVITMLVIHFYLICPQIPPIRYAAQPTGTSCLSTRRAATYHETRATPTQSPTIAHTSLPGESSDSVPRLSVRKHVQFGGDVPPADTGDFLHAHWKQSQHTQDNSHSSKYWLHFPHQEKFGFTCAS